MSCYSGDREFFVFKWEFLGGGGRGRLVLGEVLGREGGGLREEGEGGEGEGRRRGGEDIYGEGWKRW
jgi:hypothetical protein